MVPSRWGIAAATLIAGAMPLAPVAAGAAPATPAAPAVPATPAAPAVPAVPAAPAVPAVPAAPVPAPARARDAALGEAVRRALVTAGFTGVVDFGADEGTCPGGSSCPAEAPSIAHVPSIDAAVIELDGAGRVTGAADVLLSRDYPQGLVTRVDADLVVSGVRWYRWDQARADSAVAWRAPHIDSDDIVPGRGVTAPAGRAYPFMSPYPASLFQLLVAADTLHLVDRGVIALDADYPYLQAPGSTCLGETFTDTRTTRELLDRMVTASDNRATCMLLKQLTDLDQLDAVNAWTAGLGLTTLQLGGIDPGGGGRWDPGRITMTALDTARLLLLVNGAPGVLWHAGAGTAVRAVTVESALSTESRRLLLDLLRQQGFNEVLSTANWCGRDYPATGIPHQVDRRWIDPATGTVTVDDIPYGQDVRGCDGAAQVAFAHKTGVTYNFAADAGIVHSLPGARERHYIVAVITDVGYRYADPRNSRAPVLPCTVDVCFTEAFARLGHAVDDAAGASPAVPAPPAPAPAPATGAIFGTPGTGTPGTAATTSGTGTGATGVRNGPRPQ